MDNLKKSRTALRAGFTKILGFIEGLINEAEPSLDDINVNMQLLEGKFSELAIVNDKYIGLMAESETAGVDHIAKEMDSADEYKLKYIRVCNKVAKLTAPRSDGSAHSYINSNVVVEKTTKNYKLPKIELKIFGGEIKDWLQFWSLFKKIHEDNELAKEDKFQYLIQAMVSESRAADLVKSYPPSAENYDKVIASLKNRFGRDDLQVEVYVRELLQLVLQNAMATGSKLPLSSLYDKIESYLIVRALESLGVTTDKCAAMLFPLVESSLPEDLLRAWQRSVSTNNIASQPKDRLTQLIKFLEAEVENELRISMAVKGFQLKVEADSEKGKKHKTRTEGSKDIPSTAGLIATNGKPSKDNVTCLFCDREHGSATCEQARKMSLTERQEIVKKKHACFNCLKYGHSCKKCRVNIKCAWCNRRHVILMCPEMTKKEDNSKTSEPNTSETVKRSECSLASCSDFPEVFMQTLRVKLHNGNKESTVRAVIDTGSQRSYITKEAAKKIGYDATGRQTLTHSLFGGTKSETASHEKYVVHLSSVDNNYRCNFKALDQDVICDKIPSIKRGVWIREQEIMFRWKIMSEIKQSSTPSIVDHSE